MLKIALVPTLLLPLAPVRTAPSEGQVLLESPDGRTVVLEQAAFPQMAAGALAREGHLRIRFTGPGVTGSEAVHRGPLRVTLSGGNRLWAQPTGGDGDRLGVLIGSEEDGAGVRMDLPVDRIVSLVFPGRGAAGGGDWAAPGEGDRLYHRRSGPADQAPGGVSVMDREDGFLEEFTTDGVLFTSDLGQRAYGWDQVGALFIEALGGEGGPEPAEPGEPAAVRATVDLLDGGRLDGTLLLAGGSGCRLSVPGCGDLGLPAAVIDQILIDDGSLAFLSDLRLANRGPLSPFGDELGMTWPPRVDLAVTGGPLLGGGRRWSRGMGVHAPSELTWDLEGWSLLRGTVSVDGSARLLSARGSVVFRVLLDGRELWASPVLTADDAPVVLPALDISAGRELVLRVSPTDDGFAGDRGNWLDLLLVR